MLMNIMKKVKKIIAFAILMYILILTTVFGLTFEDSTQTSFNNGTYNNTIHNGTALILSGTNLSGTYTSRIFDATALARWNNISWQRAVQEGEDLFAADNDADVWRSNDSGLTWALIKDDYNNGDTNGATYMVKNSSRSLFILINQDLWASNNLGINWTKINNDFNPSDTNNGLVMEIDGNDNIYIIDGSQDVWRSNNSGVSFTKVNPDFNGANGNALGMSVNNSNTLFIVDAQADIWQSINAGVNWTQTVDDYNAGNGNSADDMSSNSSGALFILDNQDVWASNNSGVNWTLVNDDFNLASDTNAGKVMYIDKNNSIYIIDGSEDVYKSTNSGKNFSLIASNFNGANGNSLALTSALIKTNITYQVKNCSSSDCTDAVFMGPDNTTNTFFTNTFSYLNLNGRFFQYKFYMTRDDASLKPQLFNVSIDYVLTDTVPPAITISQPQNISYTTVLLQINFSAQDTNLQSCWYTNNSGTTNISLQNCVNTSYTASQGSTTLKIYANDTSNNQNSSSVTFFVDSITPSISYATNTPANNSILSLSSIFINVSIIETNFANITFSLYNLTSLLNQTTFSSQMLSINFTNLQETTYFYNVTIRDILNNRNATETRTILLDTTAPSISYVSPTKNAGAFAVQNFIEVNVTATEQNLDSVIIRVYNSTNSEINSTKITSSIAYINFSTLANGLYFYNATANDTAGNLATLSTRNITLDTTVPSLSIAHPIEGTTFGTNISLSLNYSASDINLQSCWYHIDSSLNTTISNCANITFSTTSGPHTLYLYANDTLGNKVLKNVNFTISIGSPTILLNYPINIYLNSSIANFNYTASDIDLSSCELWGDFNGTFAKNQTNNTLVSGQQSIFSLSLPDGTYKWNIYCNDTLGNSAFNGNKTFFIDTTPPSITLSQPSGIKTSRNDILTIYTISDVNMGSCLYNVYRGSNIEISNTSVSCTAGSASFNVTVDAVFTLNFYSNDSAGNKNSLAISFTVNTAPSGSGSGGSSSGGSSSLIPAITLSNITRELKLEIGGLTNIAIKRGTSTNLELEATNIERIFLNNCKLEFGNLPNNWLSSTQTKGLSVGEKYKYLFNVNIPPTAEPGEYNSKITIRCDEGQKSATFNLVVFRNTFEVEIRDYERSVDSLIITYSAQEFAQENHEIIIQYKLIDFEGTIVVSGRNNITIAPGYKGENTLEFKLPKDVAGEYDIKMVLSDGKTSTEINKKLVIPDSSILGLAVSENNRKTLTRFGVTIVIIISALLILQFIYRKYRKSKFKTLGNKIENKYGKKVIKLDIGNK